MPPAISKKRCVLCGEKTADGKICFHCYRTEKITKIINDYDLDINSKCFEKVLLAIIMIERGNSNKEDFTDEERKENFEDKLMKAIIVRNKK